MPTTFATVECSGGRNLITSGAFFDGQVVGVLDSSSLVVRFCNRMPCQRSDLTRRNWAGRKWVENFGRFKGSSLQVWIAAGSEAIEKPVGSVLGQVKRFADGFDGDRFVIEASESRSE